MATDLTRLEQVVAAYGADPARWPAAERAVLQAVAVDHTALLGDAADIDHVLSGASVPEIPGNGVLRLMQRVIPAAAEARVVALQPRRRPKSSWAIAACLAASLACGIYVGTLSQTDLLFDPGSSASDDPVDLAGLGDVTDLLGDT